MNKGSELDEEEAFQIYLSLKKIYGIPTKAVKDHIKSRKMIKKKSKKRLRSKGKRSLSPSLRSLSGR